MATTTTITKILFRRGNDADRVKTILASGEPGFALDTGRIFIGDGATPGGLPVIKPEEFHLHYVDDTGEIEGNFSRHNLDINVQGLSATLAGDHPSDQPDYHALTPKLFHPTDRTLLSTFPLNLTGDNDSNSAPSIEFLGPGSDDGTGGKEFKLGRAEGGMINIGDVIYVNTATKEFEINAPGGFTLLGATEQTFADGDATLFEDRSIDFNVPVDAAGDRIKAGQGGSTAITAESCGVYFSHMGILSAGKIGVGNNKSFSGWNTVHIRPPVYEADWMVNTPNVATRMQGEITTLDRPPMPRIALKSSDHGGSGFETHKWRGSSKYYAENANGDGFSSVPLLYGNTEQYKPADINIRSLRPGSFHSNAYKSVYEDASGVTLPEWSKVPAVDRQREDCWDGHVDVGFETGLLVYGPGDPDIQPDWNGYMMNQSVDSFAAPTFQGLRIEGPNAMPLGVESGGTGRDEFVPGRLIFSNHNPGSSSSFTRQWPGDGTAVMDGATTSPFIEIGLGNEQVLVGQPGAAHGNGNPRPGYITITSDWWRRSQSGNTINYTSSFQPDSKTAPGFATNSFGDTRKNMFFDKFVRFEAESGSTANATRFDSRLKFVGDTYNMTTEYDPNQAVNGQPAQGSAGNPTWNAGLGPRVGLKWNHVLHAEAGGGWAKGTGGGDIRTAAAGQSNFGTAEDTRTGSTATKGGHVISTLTFNKAGHLRNFESKDLDTRYPQKFNMGNAGSRSGGTLQSPSNITFQVDGLSNPLVAANALTIQWFNNIENSYNAKALGGITFNDYGTIKSVATNDLGSHFYNKSEITAVFNNLASSIDKIHNRLDNDFILARTATMTNGSTRSDTNITQTAVDVSFLNSSTVRFGSSTSTQASMYSTTTGLQIASDTDINLISKDDIRLQATDNIFYYGDDHYFYNQNGTYHLKINDAGITLASGTKLHGTATDSDQTRKTYITENDTDNQYSVTFCDNNNTSSTYSSTYKDDGLWYNPYDNTLRSKFFLGDGRHLDMANNPTIPSSIELETAADQTYNVVMSTNARDKIYDKPNTLAVDTSSGTLFARGDVIAYRNFSDKNLKTDIKDIDQKSALEKVLKLQGVTYKWKDAPDMGTKVGLIAQQVGEVVPEVVEKAPRIDDMEKLYMRVEYDKLVPLLIESVKELTGKVEELQAEIAELKK